MLYLLSIKFMQFIVRNVQNFQPRISSDDLHHGVRQVVAAHIEFLHFVQVLVLIERR